MISWIANTLEKKNERVCLQMSCWRNNGSFWLDQQAKVGNIFYNAKNRENGQTVQVSAQSDDFGKVSLTQQRRDVDLKEVFYYPLGPVPWVLAHAVGAKATTPKS